MFMINKNKNNGFSLIETIVALSLGSFLAVMIVASLTTGLKGFRELKRSERVHANAAFLGDVFQHWIKRGEKLELINPSTLKITLPDFFSKTIALTGGGITLDGSPVTSSDVEVTALNFTKLSNSIRISFSLKSKSGEESISLTTTATKRNAL